jgi:hypothetical protein
MGALASLSLIKRGGRGFPFMDEFVVVTNLDAIKSRTIAFRFNGKVHLIEPLSVDKYVEATAAMAAIGELITSKKRIKSEAQIMDAYDAIFSIMCPSVRRADLNDMSVQQIGALYNTVLEHVMGREQFEAQKKSPNLEVKVKGHFLKSSSR